MPNYWSTPVDLPQTFVTQEILSVADLMAQFPAGPTYRGKYCRVNDMWGAVDGVFRCGFNGRIYYWEPTTQPQLIGQIPVNSDLTLQPLATYPIIELTGTVPSLTTRAVTMGLDYAWPGAVKEFRASMTSLLGTLNLLGTGIGSTLSFALGGTRRIGCYDNGTALVWRQLS